MVEFARATQDCNQRAQRFDKEAWAFSLSHYSIPSAPSTPQALGQARQGHYPTLHGLEYIYGGSTEQPFSQAKGLEIISVIA